MMTFVYLNTFFPTIYKEMLINKFNMQCVSVVGGGGGGGWWWVLLYSKQTNTSS